MGLTEIDPEVIRARRKLIRDDAPCEGCGTRRADCEAQRGKDPTAPPWFGCCAQGTAMEPCAHRSDRNAMTVLLAEIEAGAVRTVDQILAERAERDRRRAARAAALTTPDGELLGSASAIFGQTTWWRRKSGEWMQIADMSPGHRYNTAAMLMRHAESHASSLATDAVVAALGHDGGELAQSVLDRTAVEAAERALHDPQMVIHETTLYQALVAGLTVLGDGTEPWQKNRRDPVTGEPCEVPPPMVRMCEIPACGCGGEAHA